MVAMRGVRSRRSSAALLLLGALALGAWSLVGKARLVRADFVMANGGEVTSLDPARVTGVPEGRVLYALFEGLVVKHPQTLEPLPGMARSWEISEDGRRYTFHLRPEARWSNGDPLFASDVEWSWRRLLHPDTAAEYAYQLWGVVAARAFSHHPRDRGLFLEQGLWVEARADTLRLGLQPPSPELLDGGPPLVLRCTPGESFERGDVLIQVGERELSAPFSGRCRAHNLPPPTGEGPVDPYAADWLLEWEASSDELEQARAQGRLLEGSELEQALWDRVGIRALDEHTLVVDLVHPTPYFLQLTGYYPLFPVHRRSLEEARRRNPKTWRRQWLAPENLVTNGPFALYERRINDRLRLRKNPYYWDADRVAMDTIDILAADNYGTLLNLYLTGEVDWIDRAPPNLVPRLLEREDFRPTPYLGVYFYRVNVTRPPLDDRRVRTALALSIDREAICEKIVKKGEQPNWGLVPHGMPGYRRAEMKHAPRKGGSPRVAFEADCERARALLAEAGFGPGGKELGEIELLYNTSEAHRDIAEVVADGWRRHLGVDARLVNQEWKVYLDTQVQLDYDVSRSSWIADYADPNNFLSVFVGSGENNRTGWSDPAYDEWIERAAREADPARRAELLRAAEEILVRELPILPIYTYVSTNLVKPRLGGFHENVQDDHLPKFLYWMDDEELERSRQARAAGSQVSPGGPDSGLYPPAAARGAER